MFWRWLFCLLEACVEKCKACAAWVLLCCYLAWARGMQISPKAQNAHERHVQDVQLKSNARVELCGSFEIKGIHRTLTNVLDTATMPRLTAAQREWAIGRLTAGDNPQTVAAAFNIYFTTVYRLQQRFVARGVTDDRPRSGRPRVTTPRQDRQIFRRHQRPFPDSLRNCPMHHWTSPGSNQQWHCASQTSCTRPVELPSGPSASPHSQTPSGMPTVGQKPRQLELEAVAYCSVHRWESVLCQQCRRSCQSVAEERWTFPGQLCHGTVIGCSIMNMFIMLHIHDFGGGSMFHCSFTGLEKGISESLFCALASCIHVTLRVFCDVNFSACVINMLTCKQSMFDVGLDTKDGL